MKIETFTVCYNEEKMLPYFLRHYLQYGSVTIFDNYSTDNSIAIAKKYGAIVLPLETGGKFREDILTHIRNECWKESKADWVIVTDTDEFVYHSDLSLALSETLGTVILPRMFNMYYDRFPKTEGQIYEEVQWGVEFNSKMSLFRPDQIREMNYDPGCHFAHPIGNFILDFRSPIINLHFKNMGQEYVNQRNAELCSRNSEENVRNGWNWHIIMKSEDIANQFELAKTRLIKVI